MKIAVIGPVAPFRSGIARHTTALTRELARRDGVDLSVVSFARQYPAMLYPGETQIDSHVSALDGLEVDYSIDSVSPLSWRAAVNKLARVRPNLCVIPAWTFFFAPCLGWIARALRRRGVPIVMIVHNVEDHEAAWWKTILSRFQLRQADRFLTHNSAIGSDLERIAPHTPIGICPHPVYDDYPIPKGELPRNSGLELLFFGLVRPYKGLDIALHALAMTNIQDLRLSVVGEFWQEREYTEALIRNLGLEAKVELVARYVSDQEVAEFFARCDAVVAPYRSATGSGVVSLAQWYGRPVIASDVPGLSAAVIDGKTGWLFPAGDIAALAGLLNIKVSRASADAMRPTIEAVRSEFTWERFVDAIIDPSDNWPDAE